MGVRMDKAENARIRYHFDRGVMGASAAQNTHRRYGDVLCTPLEIVVLKIDKGIERGDKVGLSRDDSVIPRATATR